MTKAISHKENLLSRLIDTAFDAKYTTYKGGVELTGGRGRFNASDVKIEKDVAVIKEEGTVTIIELESASV